MPKVRLSFLIAVVMVNVTAFGQTDNLAEQLMDADEEQFVELFPRGILFEKFVRRIEPLLPDLEDQLIRKLPPDTNEESKVRLARRQANAAVILMRMNKPANVWSLLKQSPDPCLRTQLIHRLGPLGVDARKITGHLNEESDTTIRRALILSLGEFDGHAWLPEDREKFLPTLREIYRTSPDPGLHAASDWLLRHWKQDSWLQQVNQELAHEKESSSSQWYINGQGQLMVVIPNPISFMMGSPATETNRNEDETQHEVRIERRFAMASKEVTVDEFLRFKMYHFYVDYHAHLGDCPVNNITWYDAVEYCNWLNLQEGIPEDQWCYQPNKDGEYKAGMTTVENYLQRTGYRLPTEVEWECACRAGAETRYSSGESADLLAKYETLRVGFDSEVSHPVGSFMPNDWGLFDMQGNIREWCQDLYRPMAKRPIAAKATCVNRPRQLVTIQVA